MPQITSKLLPLVGESNSDKRQSYLLDMGAEMTQDSHIATTHSKGDEMNNERIDVLAVLDGKIREAEQDGKTVATGLREARAGVAELIDAAPRAIEMLCVAGKHCNEFASDDTTFYDEADCDGICIDMDCESAANHLRSALARVNGKQAQKLKCQPRSVAKRLRAEAGLNPTMVVRALREGGAA